MRIIVQRVSEAAVTIDGRLHSSIGPGFLVLVGVECGDTEADARWLADKTASLRIMADEAGAMNLSILQTGGDVLAVSQFTLTASTRKGNRPSFIRAEKGEQAEALYQTYCSMLADTLGREVKKGVFGADMQVSLVNSGPVTIVIDSRLRE